MLYSIDDRVENLISLYTVTKKANWIRDNEKIQIFNYGNCKRDFTYIDDIVEGVMRVMQAPPEKKKGEDGLPVPPYAIYNIGNNHPENLLEFVDILQQELIRRAFCRRIMILTVIRSWCRCSRGMCRLFMQIHRHWSVILDSSRVRICGRGYGSLRSGIRSFIRFKMIVEIILISVFL